MITITLLKIDNYNVYVYLIFYIIIINIKLLYLV